MHRSAAAFALLLAEGTEQGLDARSTSCVASSMTMQDSGNLDEWTRAAALAVPFVHA